MKNGLIDGKIFGRLSRVRLGRTRDSVKREDASMAKPGITVGAIVPAAGESRRMGAFKPLLPWDDRTVLECSVESLLLGGMEEVVVVLGHRGQEIKERLEPFFASRPKVKVVMNSMYREGMLSSIKRGLKEAGAWDAFAVLPGDHPAVEPRIISKLVRIFRYLRGIPRILVPKFEGKRGHPLLIDMLLRDDVLKLPLDQGLRLILRLHPSQVTEVAVDSPGVLLDLDEPEDYVLQKLREKANRWGPE